MSLYILGDVVACRRVACVLCAMQSLILRCTQHACHQMYKDIALVEPQKDDKVDKALRKISI